jgi:hypothetical protein
MTEHPILFSTEMVKAILDGKKTQTRRVINYPLNIVHCGGHPKKLFGNWALSGNNDLIDGVLSYDCQTEVDNSCGGKIKCPYGKVGDHLWVRESHRFTHYAKETDFMTLQYPDDAKRIQRPLGLAIEAINEKKRPSIHMPRWASRITLEVTDIRVERVQDITHKDALAEGVEYDVSKIDGAPLPRFQELWDKINSKRGFGWDVNPWVWVIEFRKIK